MPVDDLDSDLQSLGPDDLVPLADDALIPLDDEDPSGPAFVVLPEGQSPQSFYVWGTDMVMGRGKDVHLPIDVQTVSRRHAKIFVTDEGCVIEDLLSDNGTYVNAKRIERHVLQAGDELRLGTVDLVFLGDQPEDQVYKGTPAKEMPRYARMLMDSHEDTTFQLPERLLQRMNEVRTLLARAQVVPVEGTDAWKPGHGAVRFGTDVDIPVRGWFTTGCVATLSWTGRKHRLTKLGRRTSVKVNGQKVLEQDLEPGDSIQIGKTGFRYELSD